MSAAPARPRPLIDALLPLAALAIALMLFSLFVALEGQAPLEVLETIFAGAFGDAFGWQNTLLRAAPLILTGLAVALPARAGLVIIGGEGALAFGALGAAAVAVPLAGSPNLLLWLAMALAGMLAGGVLIGFAGALRQWRGVNETISSLLLSYIAVALMNHFVEGPLRDPASLNKPSTYPLAPEAMLGALPGLDVHVGLAVGVVCALLAWVFLRFTVWGFAVRVVGGNPRAAAMAGLAVTPWVIGLCAAGGAMAGLAGMIEVAAVHGACNASVLVGYGHAGILIAFIARQNPLAVVPAAILIGGIGAAGSLLQRRLDMPDATVLVLQGILFVVLIAIETLRGHAWRLPQLATPRRSPTPALAAKTDVSV
ncbi:ABC transporter permease [Niveibacterium umoris]|uniref:Simple sugar transport system permease protein n=1 Tax=Niveibacterium umoris TaxID=1193620 RepID=A0A840BL12_9RHOO|nr:ABC transporter permease [Niveibacterium umoris]MBB4011576.1 simple sugar transport system permease protein [Niveibacterium umoris]